MIGQESDNVTSHTKGVPHYTERILTTDEYTDVLWIQHTIYKTTSYTARNNNYPDIYYYMSKYGSSSTVYQAEQIAF
jgi:3-methyladenine DNA glycosylase AlkD